MKKPVVLITAILLITMNLSIGKAADSISKSEFSIHNGTKFGMPSSEVRSIEKSNGVELTDIDSRWDDDAVTSFFTQPRISLAGRDEGEVSYVFSDDALVYVNYWLNIDDKNADEMADDFNELLEALVNKYGMPDYYLYNRTSSSLPREYYCQTTQVLALTESDENYKAINYAQWEIDCGDGSGILIDFYLYFYNSEFRSFFSEGINYTWFDEAIFSSTMEGEIDRQKQMNDDI